jgi:hypothetical protein
MGWKTMLLVGNLQHTPDHTQILRSGTISFMWVPVNFDQLPAPNAEANVSGNIYQAKIGKIGSVVVSDPQNKPVIGAPAPITKAAQVKLQAEENHLHRWVPLPPVAQEQEEAVQAETDKILQRDVGESLNTPRWRDGTVVNPGGKYDICIQYQGLRGHLIRNGDHPPFVGESRHQFPKELGDPFPGSGFQLPEVFQPHLDRLLRRPSFSLGLTERFPPRQPFIYTAG